MRHILEGVIDERGDLISFDVTDDVWALQYPTHRRAIRAALIKRFGNRCVYCGGPDPDTIDHWVPQRRDGSHVFSNLVLACHSCNAAKHANDPIVWTLARAPYPDRAVALLDIDVETLPWAVIASVREMIR